MLDLYHRIYDTYMFLKQPTTPSESSLTGGGGNATTTDPETTTTVTYLLPKTRNFLQALLTGSWADAGLDQGHEAYSELQVFAVAWKNRVVRFSSSSSSQQQSTSAGGQASWNSTTDLSRLWSQGGEAMMKATSFLVVTVVHGFLFAFNLTMDVLIFVAALYQLVLNKHSPMHYLSQLLVAVDPQERIRVSMERSIKAIILSTLKLTVFHALLTWLTFSLVGVDYVYFASLLSGLMAAVPLISPVVVVIPALFQLFLQGSYVSILLLLAAHLWAYWVVVGVISSSSFLYLSTPPPSHTPSPIPSPPPPPRHNRHHM